MAKINGNLAETMQYMERTLRVRENFDLMCRILRIGSYRCAVYCFSGFANNAILEKLLEAIMGHTEEIRPKDMDMFFDEIVPYASA